MKKYYLAYGSNLNCEQMMFRCPDAVKTGKAELRGWKLVFNGVATIERDEHSITPVGVWKISEQDEKSLDRYEGYPHLYRKEYMTMTVKSKNNKPRSVKALVYVMNKGRRMKNPPSEFYFDTIIEGYRDFDLDSEPLYEAYEDSLN